MERVTEAHFSVIFMTKLVYKLLSTDVKSLFFKSNENTNLMQHCAGFISAESLYMIRAQAPIIRSI